MSCFNISFSGVFQTNGNQQTLINFSKAIISSYADLLFKEELKVTLTTSEGKIEIIDIVISVKSNDPNDELGWVPLIILLEYQLAYPDCKSVKALSDEIYFCEYITCRSQIGLRKIISKVKGNEKIETIHPFIVNGYCSYVCI
jgi:hypothetical protein